MKHFPHHRPLAFAIALCSLTSAIAAQQVELARRADAPSPATVRLADPVPEQAPAAVLLEPLAERIGDAIGFAHADGQLVGAGPSYRVHFGARGPLITTPLGAQAKRSLPLSFELESIRRGEQQLASAGPSTPVQQGHKVVYARGAAIDERYELRRDGVEQSFAIASLPAGEGDLVVRGRLVTELVAPAAGAYPQGLSFRAPAWNGSTAGGVSIGGVTGIDAGGARVQGELRWDGTHVEYALPHSFVATARFPLVVDPLFGSEFPAASGADFADPDVAYDESGPGYLVVFERQYSGTDIDIHGQMLFPNGSGNGGLQLFETSFATIAVNPSVGNVNSANRWFVAWQQSASILGPWDVYGASLVNWGQLSAPLPIATQVASEIEPDVAGERFTANGVALVVWERVGGGVFSASIDVTLAAPTIATTNAIAPTPNAHRPSVSQAQNEAGLCLVVYSNFYASPAPGDHDLVGVVVNVLGQAKTVATPLLVTLGADEDNADVVSGLDEFAVAFEWKASITQTQRGILTQRARFDPVAFALETVGPTVIVEDDTLQDELAPAIAYTGLKYHLAYLEQRADFGYDLALRELDPADCLPCSQKLTKLGSSATSLFAPAVSSRFSGSASSQPAFDTCMVVYESASNTLPFVGGIVGQIWESVGAGGSVVNLGGGCAGGGTAGTVGPIAPGSPTVTLTLSGAAPTAAIGIVNLNPGPATMFPCGSCLAPLPGILINRPIVAGNASLLIPTPCDAGLIGAVLDFDWKVVGVPTTPCPLVANLANSNVLRITIGQ